MGKQIDVRELAHRCREETSRYLRGEAFSEHACLELFRRAIVERDDAAWESVYTQYAGLARIWLNARMDNEDEGVNAAFERFWRAVDSAKFARFGSLAAVLGYLKMCVRTTVLDHVRAQSRSAGELDLDAIPAISAQATGQADVGDRLDAADLWRQVGDILTDERERRVIYLSYVIGLSPREIRAYPGGEFPRMDEIYRLKRTALDRLRRSAAFCGFFSAAAREDD
jgi:DNA-directed RNA polymerase specialized sigma24 family protein